MRILQINTTVNSGSTGRIAEDIGAVLLENDHESYIAFGRGISSGKSVKYRIGSTLDKYLHFLESYLFDYHGFASRIATKKLIEYIKSVKPDAVGLHNLHGYYLNISILFKYLKDNNIPTIWTMHDCWPITGHCSYFDRVNCERWKTHCSQCPNLKGYPKSLIIDSSHKNFNSKRSIFVGHPNLTIITPSNWLAGIVKESFMKDYSMQVIHNGIDTNVFIPKVNNTVLDKYKLAERKYVLGVASLWDKRKGLIDSIEVGKRLDGTAILVLVGLNDKQIKSLPENIVGVARTENLAELVALYSGAHVFINPTYVDNFPTTNIEALACGTPVITYNTGGSPEAIDEKTGVVVEKGDVNALFNGICDILEKDKSYFSEACRKRALMNFDKNHTYIQYMRIFETLISVSLNNK